VRDTGRARDAATPVLLERDRRDPRRHGTVTFPAAPAMPVTEPAEAAPDDRVESAPDDREEAA
jgi:hypothetical protein